MTAMTEKEYQQLQDQLRTEYESRLAALKTIWEWQHSKNGKQPLAHSTHQPAASAEKPAPTRRSKRKRKQYRSGNSTRGWIRKAIRTFDEDFEFNQDHVRAKLKELNPELEARTKTIALSSHLLRLAEGSEIDKLTKGTARNPTRFKRNGRV